jgi:multidrug efflux pump subunit AcrB
VPGGFIPDEDKGFSFVAVELPEGASLQRTDEILKQVEAIVGNTKGVRSAVGLAGYNILNSLNFPNTAMMFVGLEPGRSARRPSCTPAPSFASGTRSFSPSRRARFCLRPAAAAGLRQRVRLQHAVAGPLRRQHRATGRLLEATHRGGSKRPEIGRVSTTFNPATPQVKVELDREKARTLGVPVDSVSQRCKPT